jgi:hypothetical protein
MQVSAWLRRNWAPITAAVLAPVFVVAALYAHRRPWLDPDSASRWKHDLALALALALAGAGAALALAGSPFQGVKSHGRARRARTRTSTVSDEDARFFHHVGILWWIVSAGAILALLGEILDL